MSSIIRPFCFELGIVDALGYDKETFDLFNFFAISSKLIHLESLHWLNGLFSLPPDRPMLFLGFKKLLV